MRESLVAEIDDAIRDQRFGAIVIDNTSGFFGGVFDAAIVECYAPRTRVFANEHVFWPVTGFHTRPEEVFVPRAARGCGPDREAPTASGP
jgi:hypothetical protein